MELGRALEARGLWTSLAVLGGLGVGLVTSGPSTAQDLGNAQLLIAGTRLIASPEAQTVPFDTPTIVQTTLEGYDAANGMLPSDLRVVADFVGPGIDGVLRLSTRPNEPFRIPRLTLKGQYQLENIRLVQQTPEGDTLLAYAEPRSAGVLVTQVLVTTVTSRPLTLDEIRSYGIVVDDDNFKAFNFTFGFGVDGQTYDYNIPVLFSAGNAGDPERVRFLYERVSLGSSWGTTSARFQPPQIAPFTLELKTDTSQGQVPGGGCTNPFGDCSSSATPPIPGVVLFPTDVAMLHQFFSVVVLAKNDAPAGDPLVIRDLTAKMILPPGLRQAETEPPTPLGVPIPVRVPGPDGRLGSSDDITFLVAQASGQAEALVEGRQEGVHLVEFQLEGILDGLPDGQIRRIEGAARGAVLVRDATLGVTVTHPSVIRTDEEYSLILTVSNTSAVPANLISFSLPVSGLSGAVVVGNATQSIASLAPGESEVVEFRLRALRTGRVYASSVRSGSQASPSFELTAGVGENGIPLSPTSIILPRQTESLPPELARRALALVGLGFSLATVPANQVSPTLPQLNRNEVDEKVYWLGQMGRHVALGEELFDSAAIFASEWLGARDHHWEWDELRRTTEKGALLAQELSGIFAAEAVATSPLAAFDRHTSTTAFLGPIHGALAVGTGARLEVSSRTSGLTVAGLPGDGARLRELPFAELYDLGTAEMVTLAVPEDNGYQARLIDDDGGLSALHLRVPDDTGAVRRVSWSSVSLSPGGTAVVDFQVADQAFTLFVDTEGDGVVDAQIPGTVQTVAPRAFTAQAAVQNPGDPAGHLVEVLFTADVDLVSLLPRDPQRFVIPNKISNGGLIPSEVGITQAEADRRAEEGTPSTNPLSASPVVNPFAGLRNSRIVRVIFNNPISPLVQNDLTIRDLSSMTGESVIGTTLPVQTTVTDPGGLVQGSVRGPDGELVPFARVDLFEADVDDTGKCALHRTASVQADAAGALLFDYVRQTGCSDIFTLAAQDPVSGQFGTARGRIRLVGETVSLDIVMLGRGTIRGRVTYEDGTVPVNPEVVAFSPVFADGRRATVDANGFYEVDEIPVGTVTLGASDREGNFVYQTVEIPTAGAVTERNLTIIRRPPDLSTGDVRGTVYASDGVTPSFDAYLALYVSGELVGVQRSGLDGSFDFGTVPAGAAEIEAFDGQTGLSGAQIFFQVQPDQINDIPVLLQDDRGTVEGQVLRETDTGTLPVAGAVVWVSGTPFNTVTDDQGFYRLEGVFAGNRTILAADLERQVQISEPVTINAGGATVTRNLIFFDTTSVLGGIAGQVLGFNGSPVNAVLHLSQPGLSVWWGNWTTGADGRFFIPDLGPGTYQVHAISGGSGATATVTIRFKGETPSVTLSFKKGTIKGVARAIDEIGDLVGVKSVVTYRVTTVALGFVTLDPQEKTLETAADGSFTIPDALAGPYVLTVHNAFHGEKTIRGELFFHGEVQEHEVVFERNGTIRGRVLDWDGQTPVVGARVRLEHPSFSTFDLFTDQNGEFTFDLVPPTAGRFPIEAEIDDGVLYRTAQVWVRFDRFGQELDVEIPLQRQGTVSGFVEDANGIPVPGAEVTLREHGFPARRIVQNADGEGFFSFRNVFAGRITLSAKAPSLGGLASTTELTLTGEGEAGFATLTLEATGEIVGTVISPVDGLPVPSAQVALYQMGRGLFDAVTADQLGQFRFPRLPLAQYRVLVFDPRTGRYGQLDGAWVEFNNHVRQVQVVLEVRGDVDGHLREPGTETPVPAATIRLSSDAIVPFTTFSSTDVGGYFELLGIPEGAFSLGSREPGGRRKASGAGEITMEGQRVTVDLYLEDSGTVTGTVLAPPGQPDGPFPNANVLIRQDGLVIGATLDNPYTFTGVIADRPFEILALEMGADHEGLATGTLTTQGEQVTVDVRMKPIASVAVTVTDSLGNPVSGADVSMTNRSFYARHNFGGSTSFNGSTAADGRIVFQGVGEGSVTVSAVDPLTGLRGAANTDIDLDGVVVEVPVQLEDSGDIVGRVLLSDGLTPAEGALVVVITDGRTLQTFADPNGDFSFTAMPLGGFQLFLTEGEAGAGQAELTGTVATNGEMVNVGTVVLDDVDPAVISFDPVADSRDLPRTTAVTVRFSEPLDLNRAGTSWFSFLRFSGGAVGYSLSWPDASTAVLTPTTLLDNFTGYQVIVRDAVDPAGRHLTGQVRTLFYTQDTVPPTVLEVDPRPDQNQVPVDANLTVTFSEPVVLASLSGSSFQLTDLQTGLGVTTTFQLLIGERQVRLTPATGLLTDRQYQLTVQGVQDGSGNTMTAPVSTTFWTVDTIPPDITAVNFPAGTSLISGDDVPLTVQATDFWGVASATATLGPSTSADSDPTLPFELQVVAPFVSATQSVTVSMTVTDVHGNTATTNRTLQISPRVNASPPATSLGCFRSGDVVVPGWEVEVEARATDDEAVESLGFAVDGIEVDRVDFVNLISAKHRFAWTPPVGTLSGTIFVLRVEARDYAGNITASEVPVTASVVPVRLGGGTLSDVVPGSDLVLGTGSHFLASSLQVGSLVMLKGSELLVSFEEAVLHVTGDAKIQCGATVTAAIKEDLTLETDGVLDVSGLIDGSGLGYSGGSTAVGVSHWGEAPAGVSPAQEKAGGSHGGRGTDGRQSDEIAGEVYGSVYRPRDLGGGGGGVNQAGASAGGAGGSSVSVAAGTLHLDGEIRARGGAAIETGGGAGGSVLIEAGVLQGAGRIDVRGGDSDDQVSINGIADSGAGGGGRVALVVGTLLGFDPVSQVLAWGGEVIEAGTTVGVAAPGTVLVKLPTQSYGDLIVDPGVDGLGMDRPGGATELPELGSGGVTLFEVVGADAWVTGAAAFRPRWEGAWMALLDAAGAELGTFEVVEVDASGRVRLAGAGGVLGAVSYEGRYRFDDVSLLHGAGLESLSPVESATLVLEGEVELDREVVATDMTIRSGAVVRPVTGGSLSLDVSGTLTVEPGAVIDLSGLGYTGGPASGTATDYRGGAPAGVAPAEIRGGGSNGGRGLDGRWSYELAGEVYGSVYRPSHFGGGGGGSNSGGSTPGGSGGGALELVVGTLHLDGEIRAPGISSIKNGGGAGGSVSIQANVLEGVGSIDVHGGDSDDQNVNGIVDSGAGGGGRVALRVGTLLGFDPVSQVKAWGGEVTETGTPIGVAAPGTVLVKLPTHTYGELIVDPGVDELGSPRPGGVTDLPELGSGAVTLFEVAGADGWVTGTTAFLPRWLGAWMVLRDTAGTELGAFEVVEIDASGRLRLAGAGGVLGATTFEGQYRFDDISLLHGGGVDSVDPLTGATLVLEGLAEVSAEVVASNVLVKSGAVVRPASGSDLRMVVSGTVTVEAGAVIDLSGLGWPGGTLAQRPGQAPAWMTGSTEPAGGSHGGSGTPGMTNPIGSPGGLYDSVYLPREAGGGGAYWNATGATSGGAGGGSLTIETGTLILDGEIRSRGASAASLSAGGAGGSVLIQAQQMQGTGSIDVRGGDTAGTTSTTGPGGGGRVALHVGALGTFDPQTQVQAAGGVGRKNGSAVDWATPGTVLVKLPTHSDGELIVDSGVDALGSALPAAATELPELGSGSVLAFEAAGADAWITGLSAFPPRWEGAWMVVRDGAGVELGAFRVAEVDATGRSLLSGAGAVTGAASFDGEYRFDTLRLLGSAGLSSLDPVRVSSLVADGDVEVPAELSTGSLTAAPGAEVRPVGSPDLVLSATGDVTVSAGAVLGPLAGGRVSLSVGGTLTVELGAAIDGSGLGYSGGSTAVGVSHWGEAPAGVSPAQDKAGGSHGGRGTDGRQSDEIAGEVYGSVYRPRDLGGGGGGENLAGASAGGAGGSSVSVAAGTLHLDGEIRARGGAALKTGGGAGGSVLIEAGVLQGAGRIDVRGGDSDDQVSINGIADSGAGGGGRVALVVGTLLGFDPVSQVLAWGGEVIEAGTTVGVAAPGTVLVKLPTQSYGDLIVDPGVDGLGADRPGGATELPELGSGGVTLFEVVGADAWVTGAAAFRPLWEGAWMALMDSAGSELGAFEVVEVDAAGRVRLAGAGGVLGAVSFEGRYRFDDVSLLHGAGLESLSPVESATLVLEGEVELDRKVVATDMTIRSGAVVRPVTGGSLSLAVSGTLTVEPGAVIDLSGLGYAGGPASGTATDYRGGAPTGVAPAERQDGGSHGGQGLNSPWSGTQAGEVYGSVYRPSHLGSGGGGSAFSGATPGGSGGGALELVVGTLHLDGEIRALGISSIKNGGGAGGSVSIQANVLEGLGSIDVRGGDSDDQVSINGAVDSGAGGGGRVALRVGTLLGFDPASQVKAWGGEVTETGTTIAVAASGTVYAKQATQTWGDLWILDSPTVGLPAPTATELPQIGRGTVGLVEIDTSDATDVWIEPADPAKLHSLGVTGMWVRIPGVTGTDYPVIAESADRRRLLLDGAAGSVQVGDEYLGVYRFDTVTVTGDAGLLVSDATDEVGQFVVDPTATLQVLDVFPPVLTVTDPVANTLFQANKTIPVAVNVSDASTVTQVTFALGTSSFVDDTPPWEAQLVTPGVTESTSVPIHIEALDSEGNLGAIDHPITVDPSFGGPPPDLTLDCPTPGVRLAPGTGLDLFASASHLDGIDRVELLLGTDPTVLATDLTAPYQLHFDAPSSSVEGDVLEVKVRAWSTLGTSAESMLYIPVVEGAVIAADTYVGPVDVSLDGGSVIVTGGAVLTIEGPHTFRDLIVLDGAAVSHPVSSSSVAYEMDVTLSRDLVVACSGALDTTGLGLPGGSVPYGSAANFVGATHGGQAGAFNGSGRIYGNLFDPADVGGGGGTGGGAGGGVIRIAATGQMVIDGLVSASGESLGSGTSALGAGGSIRLDASAILGQGSLEASGGTAPSTAGAGGGGRIALYAASIDAGLLSRTFAAGGDSSAASKRGAAGTLFTKLDSQLFGDLILDNAGRDADGWTELPAVAAGVIDSVTATSVTDLEAAFPYSLVGAAVAFNGDLATLWPITGHTDGSQTLDLDTSTQALTAVPGDTYEIVYRFDRVVARNGAQGITLARVVSGVPEIDATSSWTPGYQPALTLTQPVAGSSLTAGDTITFVATADDVFGLSTPVSFDFNGQTKLDSSAPYQASFVVPPTQIAGTLPVTVSASDRAGHPLTATSSFDWLPTSDASPPVVTLDAGPVEGEVVEAGRAITLATTFTDGELLWAYRFLVDGVLQTEVTELSSTTASDSFTWTPPAGAAAGTMYTLRLEAEDFGTNVGWLQRTVVISDPALSGSLSLDSTYDGQNLVLGAGTFTVTEPFAPASLRLLRDAYLVPSTSGRMDLSVVGELRVQPGAFIDATGLGYAGGTSVDPTGGAPVWVTGPSPDAGGGHGGVGIGWQTMGPSGEEYDSVYAPDLAGGGGAQDHDGSGDGLTGGGVLVIDAASVVLDGEIRARGSDSEDFGRPAGGGGSVRIRAASLSGTGLVDASGGTGRSCTFSRDVGPGGGGRVALEVDSLTGFDVATQIRAWGGALQICSGTESRYAAPGTVYVRTLTSTWGDLRIDAGMDASSIERTKESTFTTLPALGTGAVTLTEVSGTDLWVTSDVSVHPRWLGAWMVLEDATGSDLGTYEVVALDGTTRALLAGAAAETGAVTYRGEYRFDRLDVLNGAGLESTDLVRVGGEVLAEGTGAQIPGTTLVTQNLRIPAGATVTVVQGDRLDLVVSGTLTVETGAVLDATGLGYAGGTSVDPTGGAPAWVTGPSPDAGGGHGGVGIGWQTMGPSGEEYDSVYAPDLAGGGGAQDHDGSGDGLTGGGVLVIDAGSVVLDGEIRARGSDSEDFGRPAGGGGSVRIRAASVSGTGLVDASGGTGRSCTFSRDVGPGGGGRVALEVDSLTGFDVATQVRAWGGALQICSGTESRYAAPGTVYVRTLTSTWGDLRIDAGTDTSGIERTKESTFTTLPALGTGAVTLTEVSGTDLWVTSDVSVHPRWLGAWMVLEDATGSDLGTYEVVALGGTTRALLAGAAAETGAVTYRGEYRFDRLDVLNGAGLESTDLVRVGGEVLAEGTGAQIPGTTLVTQNLRIPAGATVTATQGDRLDLVVSGTLTVEAGAVLEVTGLGFAGGTATHPEGFAPAGVQPASIERGGSHGGWGDEWHLIGNPAGEIYDSVVSPSLPGGGAGQDNDGSGDGLAGGGVLSITAGSVWVDGEIRADGASSDNLGRGGGGGGTVNVQAGSLGGLGSITADGGYVRACWNGGGVGTGGGGRVALQVDDLSGFDVETQARAWGGTFYNCSWGVYRCSASGTVWARDLLGTDGDLFVTYPTECAGTTPVKTVLPSPGSGVVGGATLDSADPAHLWVEPQDPAALFDLGVSGMWLRIGASDYRILDQTADRRQVLLENAAGIVSVGDSYQGVYKLDSVTARGGTILEFLDTAEIGLLDVDATSQVITPP